MSCNGNSNCNCGCCSGISVQTPRGENNAPGLAAISYRTGTWATFKESMLARLSSSDYPALAGLKTRDDDDYSIALLDASAIMLDILTFYQERLANESYLRTATQLYSLTRLSQLIGYQPSPGVSSSVYLAFTLSFAPGSPTNPGTTAITIPAGSSVQSVPAQGQLPQIFQTSADILGKPDWNALPVQTGNPWTTDGSQASVYLAGTATQLQPGDAFLIVGGGDYFADPTTLPWLAGLVTSVQTDMINQRTLVRWSTPLGSSGSLSGTTPMFFAMRQRAALFGYNALNPQMLTSTIQGQLGLASGATDWNYDKDSSPLYKELLVDLDAVYSRIVAPGWVVLVAQQDSNTAPAAADAFPIQSVASTTRSDYGMSAKISRVALVTPGDSVAALTLEAILKAVYTQTRKMSLLVQNEQLTIPEQPLDHPLYGTLLDLEVVREDIAAATAVAITGKAQIMTVNAGTSATFTPYDGNGDVALNPGDQVTLLQPPPAGFNSNGSIPSWASLTGSITMVVADPTGRSGTINAPLSGFTLALAPSSAPVVQELALVSKVMLVNGTATTPARTRIVLQNPLLNCYDRAMTTVNANVGAATAGSAVTELLGNGAAATPNQAFNLKQTPLTYVQAPTPSGRQSSLQVTANGAAWTEAASLYAQAPAAQVFAVMNLPGGGATVQFGDGVEGSTLPTGQNNIIANYRIGIGSAGNVAAGMITTLMDRPVGVSGVINPMGATGGQDAQSVEDIRTNAPQSVLTLGRAVSVTDYQNFAATFAGIAKASAIWAPNGVGRGVYVTVAASGGQPLQPGNLTLKNLTTALLDYGNPGVPVFVQSFYETLFGLQADIAYDPAYNSTAVEAAVMGLLTSTYSFAARTFGQGVSGDEVAALVQGVAGVLAVNVTSVTVGATSNAGDLGSAGYSVAEWNLWIAGQQTVGRRKSKSPTVICPYVPVATIKTAPTPAEILVISPVPTDIVLGVMA